MYTWGWLRNFKEPRWTRHGVSIHEVPAGFSGNNCDNLGPVYNPPGKRWPDGR